MLWDDYCYRSACTCVCLLWFVVESDIYLLVCVFTGISCVVSLRWTKLFGCACKLSVGEANRYCMVCVLVVVTVWLSFGARQAEEALKGWDDWWELAILLSSLFLFWLQAFCWHAARCGACHVQKNTCLARRIAEELQIVDWYFLRLMFELEQLNDPQATMSGVQVYIGPLWIKSKISLEPPTLFAFFRWVKLLLLVIPTIIF